MALFRVVAERDDFPQAVKERLARRTGYRCSRPGCRAPTVGPADGSKSGTSNVGVAAHITAASPGGPRFDERLTREERQAVDNGIWLCQNDAKAVDDDARRFDADLLRAWRATAERLATRAQGRPMGNPTMLPRVVMPFDRALGLDNEHLRTEIHDFLSDVGAGEAWNPHADLVYMVLYELAINALRHGDATVMRLTSSEGAVTFVDNGSAFGLTQLRTGGRGGNLALIHLERSAAGSVTVRYQRQRDRNIWSIVDEVLALGSNTPCGVAIRGRWERMFDQARTDVLSLDDCDELHLYPPALWSVSDWYMLREALQDVLGTRSLVIHGFDRSASVRELVEMLFPGVRMPD